MFFTDGLKKISFQNFTFIWRFCRLDFEIIFCKKSDLIEEKELSKKRTSVIFSILKQSKKTNNKFLGKTAWKYLIKNNLKFKDNEKNENKSIFRKALIRNKFYTRESKEKKKR
jgi:hypothetical protein